MKKHQDSVSLHKHQWQLRGLQWFKAGLSKAQLAGERKGWNTPGVHYGLFWSFCFSSAAHSNCQWLPDGDQWGSKQSYQWLAHPQCGGELWMDEVTSFSGILSDIWSGESQPGIWSPHSWGHSRLSRNVEVRLSLYRHTRADGEWHCSLSFLYREGWQGWVEKTCPLLW